MTEEEKAAEIAKQVKAHKKAISDRKAAEIKAGFLNPFGEETSYKEFLEAVGEKSVAEYCKGKLSKDQLIWLEKEIELYNANKE